MWACLSWGSLKAFLNSLPRTGDTILVNERGGAYRERSLREAYYVALKAAGLDKSRRVHDFRGTLVTALSDMGATEAQVAAITGHAVNGEAPTLAVYRKKTKAQAEAAMQLVNASWIGKLQNKVPTGALIR